MLTAVEVINARGENLLLSLQDVSNGYLVKNIEGLDPVKATIVTSNFAMLDGVSRQASHREARNIVMTLGLEPDYVTTNVSGLRNALYRYLLPKSQVTLRFYLDGVPTVEIEGEVESFTSSFFSADPELQISIMCFNPDFHAQYETSMTGESTTTAFDVDIDYIGTVETGFLFSAVSAYTDTQELNLIITGPDGSVETMTLEGALPEGSGVIVSTVVGNKYVIRGSNSESLLYTVDPASQWPKLYPGLNHIRVVTSVGGLPWNLTFTPKYGGL